MRQRRDAVVTRLTTLLATMESGDAETRLQELVDWGVRHVPGCRYAGISLAGKGKAVSNVTATHRYPMVFDAIQNRCGEGPCVAGSRRHRVTHIDDLDVEQRWPRYRRRALEATPIRSVLSYELPVGEDGRAALNFYADQPRAFNAESLEFGAVLAAHVALAWSMTRRHDRFSGAPASRHAIGRAGGVITERFGPGAVEAFELPTRPSELSDTEVTDTVAALIDGERPASAGEPSAPGTRSPGGFAGFDHRRSGG